MYRVGVLPFITSTNRPMLHGQCTEAAIRELMESPPHRWKASRTRHHVTSGRARERYLFIALSVVTRRRPKPPTQWTLYVWLAVVHLNSIATGGSCSSAAVLTFSTSYPTTSRLNESWNPLYFILFAPTISASILVLFTLPNEFHLTLVYILDEKSPWTNPTLYTSSLHRTTMEQLPSVASPSQTNLTGL